MINIALLTTSSRTLQTAEILHKEFGLKLIVTKTDKIIGRSKTTEPNEIKKFAIENNISFIEIEKLNEEKKLEIYNSFIEKGINLGISFDFGFIIPENIFNLPEHKIINIHFSLLPKHRGASAVQFAILADDKEFGITYHLVAKKLDFGEIVYQTKYELDENLTAGEGYSFLFEKTAQEITNLIKEYLEGEKILTIQNENEATYTYSKTNPKYTFIFKEDAYTSLEEDERTIFRKIKAYNPWPLLYTEIKNLRNLTQFKKLKLKNHVDQNLIIKIINGNFVNNNVVITELTPANGKKTQIKDFINGYFEKA